MGNFLYADKLTCYDNMEVCTKACPRYECLYVDKCGGSPGAHYVCLPFDMRLLMWLLVAVFLIVVLGCSALVVCYALRAIRMSFRHAIATENDIVFYNANNVHAFPHPANAGLRYKASPQKASQVESQREFNLRRNGYI